MSIASIIIATFIIILMVIFVAFFILFDFGCKYSNYFVMSLNRRFFVGGTFLSFLCVLATRVLLFVAPVCIFVENKFRLP